MGTVVQTLLCFSAPVPPPQNRRKQLSVHNERKLQLHIMGEYFRFAFAAEECLRWDFRSLRSEAHSTAQLCPNLLRNEDGCTNAQGVFVDGDSLYKVYTGTDGAGGCVQGGGGGGGFRLNATLNAIVETVG